MSLVLVPKGQGQQIQVRIKLNASPNLYGLTAHIIGPMEATLNAKAEMQSNFTDIYFKVSILTYPDCKIDNSKYFGGLGVKLILIFDNIILSTIFYLNT